MRIRRNLASLSCKHIRKKLRHELLSLYSEPSKRTVYGMGTFTIVGELVSLLIEPSIEFAKLCGTWKLKLRTLLRKFLVDIKHKLNKKQLKVKIK